MQNYFYARTNCIIQHYYQTKREQMTTFKLALDWTPNTNHIGFFIAKELGFYSKHGIDLQIINPQVDNYTMTPGKKLELGLADAAIAPFETVISLNNKVNKVEAVAIYAILQEDLSSIVTLKNSTLDRPKLLDNKRYASYKARYEDHIVRAMIKNDGGEGNLHIDYPEKLGIWNTLLEGKADATWIFNNWEGVEATSKQIELNSFQMEAFDIPYCYSPVILAKREQMQVQKELYRNFITATRNGFLYTQSNIEEATQVLRKYVTPYDLANIDLAASIQLTIPALGNSVNCGSMNDERIKKFIDWLIVNGIENTQIRNQLLYTNELIA